MKYFYDTEFLEDGTTIELISIGIVAEDGREYYAVSADMPIKRIRRDNWLMENVVPGLPLRMDLENTRSIDRNHPDIKERSQIAEEVQAFLLADKKPELWAWYSAYDHVVLAQLFGKMIHLPKGIPMYTNDVRSLLDFTGVSRFSLPKSDGVAHNALDDARDVKAKYDFIMQGVAK